VVDVEGCEDREILNVGPEKKAHASWFPEGQRALIVAETETHQRVGVWELDTGELLWLLDDASRNIEAAYVPHHRTDGPRSYSNASMAVIVESRQARTQTSLLDVATGEETPLPRMPGTLVPLAPAGGGAWVGRYYSSQQPTELVQFPMGGETPPLPDLQPNAFVSLTRVWDRTALTPADLVPAEDFRWQSLDGLEIQGWLYRARTSHREAEARGTIIHVHGGPTWHIEDWINPQVQYLAWQGFHVLQPNYRGSTGFSLAYREAIKEDGWGGREQDDIQTGIEALIAAGIAQPGKIGVTGTSYGGYSSWIAITRFPPELVVAAAPICGMTDLVIDWETTRPHLRPYSEEMMGGSPSQIPEVYQERSPRHHIENIRGRLLIVQGLQDPNVTPENVRVVRAALDRAGVDYAVLAFEDEGHGIHRPKNQRVLYRRLAEFFAQAFAGQ
jgi:dipeptidyl aminopeptidase/acylaminoacyl peptidase